MRLWHVCLQMFSSSRHRGFGGRKRWSCDLWLQLLYYFEYHIVHRIIWDPQTRNGGWVGACGFANIHFYEHSTPRLLQPWECCVGSSWNPEVHCCKWHTFGGVCGCKLQQ